MRRGTKIRLEEKRRQGVGGETGEPSRRGLGAKYGSVVPKREGR